MILRSDNRADWLTERSKGLGSSDIATIIGANPYRTPYELWAERKGLAPKAEGNSFLMELGHSLEPVIADFYERYTGRRILPESVGDWMYVDEEKDFLRASPDRLFELPKGRGEGILEIKSTSLRIDPDDLPRYWFCQLQYQMGIGQKEHGSIAWLSQGRDLGYQDFDFNPKFYEYLKEQATEFWERYIIGDEEPPLTSPKDYALKYTQHTEGKTLQADSETLTAYHRLKDIKTQIKDLETQEEILTTQIKVALLDAEALIDATGATLLSYKTNKDSERLDSKRLKAEAPELYASYCKTTKGARVLRLK